MKSFLWIVIVFGICLVAARADKKQLTVYWGQDSAGSLRLTLEKEIYNYCKNYQYDIIPVAFLNVFFDTANKDKLPGINLANHCNTTFDGYPTLLNCTDIGHQIQQCQKIGKKVLLSLGGAAGLYYFSSSSQAVQFANTIWNLFLDGSSKLRPFHNATLDGVDLDIEGGTTTYYADFVKEIRRLMNTDKSKVYYISGAPQCPYPDAIMGPGQKNMVLTSVPQEFDYLFVQFYNNYCSIDKTKYFNQSISSWFDFAAKTKKQYGKGPLVFIGLPASPRVRGYQTPDVVKEAWDTVKTNESLGGIMLWDASFDMNNAVNGGQHYSTVMRAIMDGAYVVAERNEKYHHYLWRHSCRFLERARITHVLVFAGLVLTFVSLLIVTIGALKRSKRAEIMKNDKKYMALQFS